MTDKLSYRTLSERMKQASRLLDKHHKYAPLNGDRFRKDYTDTHARRLSYHAGVHAPTHGS